MAETSVRRARRGGPAIRLFMSDGSERSTYMPQGQAVSLLGGPHSGVNLMSCYYPRQTFWPERRLFSEEVPHFRHSVTDQTETTRLTDVNDWTDGYYSFVIQDPDNEVVRQMADVRRYGQDVRLTVTADLDTPDEDLERIGEILKDFGRMELRLNHEANGCSWFRFARNVGQTQGEEQRRLYYEISQFFVHAQQVITAVAPNVTFVACYNGPGESIRRGEIGAGELPYLSDEELGRMYTLPGIVISLDQYGSLHCGWPGHQVENAPIIGDFTFAEHKGFSLTPYELCELVIKPFQQAMSQRRGESVRVDLGELNFDEDFHGPHIQAHLAYECYSWIRRHPEVVGSVTFYELTDMGGLGLFRQKEYGNVEDLSSTILLDVYRDVMTWPVFQHECAAAGELPEDAVSVELTWRSAADAGGLQLLSGPPSPRAVDFGEAYWRMMVISADGREVCRFTDAAQVELPPGTESVFVFAPPPDGRDNSPDGYRTEVPVPAIIV